MARVAGQGHVHNSAQGLGHSRQRATHHGSAVPEHEVDSTHDKHAGHSVAMFRDKFWLSFVLTIPTLVSGHMLPSEFGYARPVSFRLDVGRNPIGEVLHETAQKFARPLIHELALRSEELVCPTDVGLRLLHRGYVEEHEGLAY